MLKKMFRQQAYYYASTAFLVLLFTYTAVIINCKPYVGLEVKCVNRQWIVNFSDPQGIGYKLGIRVGDIILKIDHYDPGENHIVQLWGEVEGSSTLEVSKVNQPNSQIINIPKHPLMQSLLSEITFSIQGFVFLLLGFMTWFRRPFLGQARALFWLNLFTGLAIVLAPASSRDILFSKELEYIIYAIFPFLQSILSQLLQMKS